MLSVPSIGAPRTDRIRRDRATHEAAYVDDHLAIGTQQGTVDDARVLIYPLVLLGRSHLYMSCAGSSGPQALSRTRTDPRLVDGEWHTDTFKALQ
jgi:hypothetical protein